MIFTKIRIQNLYSFKDAEIDLTYPRKLKNSTIPNEHLSWNSNFKYKKVCIISGANASGKTSFGKVLCGLQNFLRTGIKNSLLFEGVSNKNKKAVIEAEFVEPSEKKLHNIYLSFNDNVFDEVIFKHSAIDIHKNETNVSARNRLKNKPLNDVLAASLRIKQRWHYLFSYTSPDSKSGIKEKTIDVKILSAVLKAMDSSILEVSDSFGKKESEENGKKITKEEKNGFQVSFENNDLVLLGLDGGATPANRLSKGTYDSIGVASFLSDIRRGSGIYFIDEQLAHTHTDVEIAMLNIMIEFIKERNSQLFFTTHNYDIFDLNIPVHSYCFLRKKGSYTQFIKAETLLKKNDRTLLSSVQNDLFEIAPELYELNNLLCYQEVE